ncbi:plastocyanin/azurin family copper-binding protein [Prosthecobacter sp.]|uniref:plastocyanin/azurin family copper-binding protein n=1 Tax=Prosthecobacter sp. TaxID=1965333 RepID=UPI002488940B|nr:plastocyanin/azurin family copper-binding protein [Prosthecobacter sp.]MDI1311600.1 plastocyanin/azurin family copper-binding protein [Prosthecobacter sp.]
MSAPSSSSEKSSSIWSVLNVIIGSVIGGVVLLWVLAFLFDGLGSLRPKPKADAAAATTAAPAAAVAAPAADLPVLELTIKPDTANPLAYDTKTISAKAGQKIKLTFNNTHPTLPQPHNIVIGKLGTKDKMMTIAMSAMTLVDKGYIPDSPDILAHTKLLQPGNSETIEFTLPAAGEYPFFCTFPGHVAIMNGIATAQ